MTQFRSGVARLSVLALTAAVAAGCGTVGPDGTGNVRVTMQKIASATATQALVDGFASSADGSYPPIDLTNVMSFAVEVTSIEFLLVGADGPWISFGVDPMDLDLMALPPAFAAPLVIADGPVAGGEYHMVRLLVSGGTIVFNAEVSVGQATFDLRADGYDVTIPSGTQTGLKTDLAFTVVAGGSSDVNLVFDPDATFQNATATGSGKVILAPVLRSLTSGDGGS